MHLKKVRTLCRIQTLLNIVSISESASEERRCIFGMSEPEMPSFFLVFGISALASSDFFVLEMRRIAPSRDTCEYSCAFATTLPSWIVRRLRQKDLRVCVQTSSSNGERTLGWCFKFCFKTGSPLRGASSLSQLNDKMFKLHYYRSTFRIFSFSPSLELKDPLMQFASAAPRSGPLRLGKSPPLSQLVMAVIFEWFYIMPIVRYVSVTRLIGQSVLHRSQLT